MIDKLWWFFWSMALVCVMGIMFSVLIAMFFGEIGIHIMLGCLLALMVDIILLGVVSMVEVVADE